MVDNYISLEKVAGKVNLPQRYIRQQVKAGKIPHLIVGGRLRFQETDVRKALSRIAKVEGSPAPPFLLPEFPGG